VGDLAFVIGAMIPDAHHGPVRVIASERAVGHAARTARRFGLAIVAQVHSHPSDDTRHSDGDDRLVLMPYEGMFSLVIGDYGAGSVGVHQFQDGRWVQVDPVDEQAFAVVPAVTDLRVNR
jgi:proteasome lid subunit RPN8/RPN11